MTILVYVSTLCADELVPQCRLISPGYLAVGNHWEYEVHVSYWDSGPVDEWHWMDRDVIESTEMQGRPVVILHTVDSMGGDVRETLRLDDTFLLSYRQSQQGGNRLALAEEDPEEVLPVWAATDANDLLFGTASVRLIIYDPPTEVNYTVENRITWLGQETIDVPAGLFLCQVVGMHRAATFPQGIVDQRHQIMYISPSLGTVRVEMEEILTIPSQDEQRWVYTAQLKSTNVQPSPLCMVRPITGDANADCRVNLEDFPFLASLTDVLVMAEHWLETGLSFEPVFP